MEESFEFNPHEQERLSGISDGEKQQLQEFTASQEGKQRIARVFEKLPIDVTEADALEAYHRLGTFLFAKEIKLDEMTPSEIHVKEEAWRRLTQEKRHDEQTRKAA